MELMEEDVPSILVPIRLHADQFVEVFIDELPDDEKDLLDLLRAEIAPLDIWHRFAVEYYRQGRKDSFREILKEAKNGFDHFEQQKKLVGREKAEFNDSKLKIINGLAADLVFESIEIRHQAHQKERLKSVGTEVLTYFNSADRINPDCPLTWACKALYEMSNGQKGFEDRAESWVKDMLKENAGSIPGLLVKGFVHFERAEKMENKTLKRKEFENSLRCYENVLRSKPDCDPTVRLGIALCCIRLGHVEKARFAFQRVLVLNPLSVDAAVGLCLLDMARIPKNSPNRHLAMQEATDSLVALRATPQGESSPMLLNHMANRSFFVYEELACTAKTVKGSPQVTILFNGGAEEVIPENMVPIRVGNFTAEVVSTTAQGDGQHILTLSKPWPEEDADELSVSIPNFKRVEADAGSAYWYSKNQAIKAEAYYFLGRNDHVRRSYKQAEKYYKGAIHLCSSFAPAQVGLARILIRDQRYPEAIAALEAAIAEFPDSCEALLLLGKLHERRAHDYRDGRDDTKAKEHNSRALMYFTKASEADPTNPDVWVARALALQRNPAKATESLESYHRGVDLLRSEGRLVDATVLTNMGALQHASGQLAKALASYHQALEVDHSDFEKSSDSTSKRHTLYVMEPANAPFWRWEPLEGTVAVDAGSNVISCSVDLSDKLNAHDQLLLVPTEDEDSEQRFRVDVTEDKMTAHKVVLKQRMFRGFTSYKVHRKVSRLPVRPSNVTTCFNLACVHEAMGEWLAAIELYKAINIKFPTYHDATLRLAKVYDILGMTNKALTYLDRVQKQSPKEPSPAAMSGSLLLRSYQSTKKTKRLDHAKHAFESIQGMDEKYKKDSYALTSIANIYFTNLHRTAPANYLKELGWAKSMYETVLKHDKSCGYAATGIANVLAQEGHLIEAQTILERVKMSSASNEVQDATLNYGHLLTIGEKYLEAIKNYDILLKKPPNYGKDPELLLHIANALFCDSRHKEALRYISRALRSSPSDRALWLNCAVLQYGFAYDLIQKNTVSEVTTGGEYAVSAKRILGMLLVELEEHDGNGPVEWVKGAQMDCDKLSELIAFCDKAISQVPDRVRLAQEKAEQYERNRKERAERLEAAAKAKAEEAAKAEAARQAAIAAAAERARQKQELLLSMASTFQPPPEKKSKKKRKAGDDDDASNYEVVDGYDGLDNNEIAKKPNNQFSDDEEDEFNTERQKKVAKPSDGLGLDDSDEEDEFNTERQKKVAKPSDGLGLDDSEEEDDQNVAMKRSKKRSSGLVESDDE